MTTYLVANRGGDYGAPMQAERPPGSGDVATCCGNHRKRCTFGRQHVWTQWRYQGPLVRTAETYACECGAVCTAEEPSWWLVADFTEPVGPHETKEDALLTRDRLRLSPADWRLEEWPA